MTKFAIAACVILAVALVVVAVYIFFTHEGND
jgi:negative regulator of sigma E activity